MRMMEKEYQRALRSPCDWVELFLRKKLTVTGISGNTQGVITASKPVKKHIKKIFHQLPVLPSTEFSVALLAMGTRKV